MQQLRKAHPDLPVLVLSHHDENEYAWRALQAGAGGYLMKQVAADELLPALRRILHGEQCVSPAIQAQLDARAVQGGVIEA